MSGRNAGLSQAASGVFVLLWSGGAIFTRLGLNDATALALLIARFSVALLALVLICLLRRQWLPEKGTRLRVAITGVLFIGGYSVCYFQAMAHNITPGLLAAVLGIQPILTLCCTERGFRGCRLAGLMIALGGLFLLVWRSLLVSGFPLSGMIFSLSALACITTGTVMQKQIEQPPVRVLPLQYAASLLLCLLMLPFSPVTICLTPELILSVVFLGLIVSVVAQLLFYRMLIKGSLVNVTSLFYLVPVTTALLDYLLLGNRLPWSAMAGMVAIFAGIWLVFRSAEPQRDPDRDSLPDKLS